MHSRIIQIILAAAMACVLCSTAQAQMVPLAVAHTIAGGGANRVDPAEQSFTISTAGTYTLTLTDLNIPARFALLSLAVTSGTALVATTTVAAGGAPAAVQFNAPAGTYVAHVVGALSAGQTYGTASVQLADSTGHAVNGFTGATNSFTAALSLPAAALPPNAKVIDTTITVTTAGTYTVDVADLGFPAALGALTVNLADPSGAAVAGFPIGTTTGMAPSATFTATAGTYHLVGAAQAASGAAGGLYYVHFHGTVDLYSLTDSVGQVASLGSATLAAGPTNLTFKDLAFPVALTQGAALAVHAGTTAATTGTPGSPVTFTAVADTYQIFALAVAAAPPAGAGAYYVSVAPQSGGPVVFSATRAAGSSAAGGAYAYSYKVGVASGGSYTLGLTDFSFPQAFAAVAAAAFQNGSMLGTQLAAAGSGPVTLAAGDVYVLVAASPGTNGQGLFGLDLSSSSNVSVFATTQGVGAAFGTTTVNVGSAGSYNVTLSDLIFPANFHDLSAVVTQGATRLGSIYGDGTFSFNAAPGAYTINVLATPAQLGSSNQSAGTFGIAVAPTPPAPTVTLTANVSEVASGGTVVLTWSSTNASTCTATGGWSGALATSGNQQSSALTSSTTFTLACTGPGGTATQAVTVGIAAPVGKSGGGAWDWALSLLLLVAVGVRAGRHPEVMSQRRH